jgi:hypothetical protein
VHLRDVKGVGAAAAATGGSGPLQHLRWHGQAPGQVQQRHPLRLEQLQQFLLILWVQLICIALCCALRGAMGLLLLLLRRSTA